MSLSPSTSPPAPPPPPAGIDAQLWDIFCTTEDYAIIMALRPDGAIVYEALNRQTWRKLDRDPVALIGTPLADVLPAAFMRPFLAECLPLLRAGQAVRRREEYGGQVFDSRFYPIHDATGRVARVVCFSHDLTAHQRLEAQLRQSQKMESIGALASGIAHDFNNILSGIIGNAELARLELPPGHPADRPLDRQLKACFRARDLVAQILAFSRHHEPHRAPADLAAIIHEALQLLRASLPASVEIRTAFDPATPPVLCDSNQIHQVILNLGANAAHAMRDRDGLLTVALAPEEIFPEALPPHPALRPGRYARLTVRDNGSGMDAATLARVFDPFFTTKPSGEGTGLGLAIVHGIVRSHDGVITASSRPGAGAEFTLHLPALAATDATARAAPTAPAPVEPRRILFVDDENAATFVGVRLLQRLGCAVETFNDPQAALAAFRARPAAYDLVLSDLTMPGLNGLALAREILALRPGLPFVLSTGRLPSAENAEARALGVRHFLPKPYSFDELADKLGQVFDSAP